MPLLEFRDVDTHYGDLHVLKSVNYAIEAGEIVCLLGGNACGKSTTMKTIMGTVRPTHGQVLFDGQPIERLSTAERVRRGIAPVLEARRLFPRMSVLENLEMGAYVRKRGPEVARDLERVFALFPRLRERTGQVAGTMSGGEQQMLAIGRALMGNPRVLLMDEPSEGLAPLIVAEVGRTIAMLKAEGLSIVLVEQNSQLALDLADTVVILTAGRRAFSGSADAVRADDSIIAQNLGVFHAH